MKLILSSNDFSRPDTKKCIEDNLSLPLSECRLLYIPNEKASAKQMRSDRFQKRCAAFGLSEQNVIVLDYYHAERFTDLDIDAMYIGGGNTFSTYMRILRHGFSNAIRTYAEKGVVYIGGSCGAHIAGTDLKHVLAFDENTCGMTDFHALGLFRGRLICHYSEERAPVYKQLTAQTDEPVYRLRNGDSIVVEDASVRFFPSWDNTDISTANEETGCMPDAFESDSDRH